MRRWRLAGLIAGGLVIVVLAGVCYLRASLPRAAVDARVAGLEAPVEVLRDAHGVPHIFAATDRDAAFALGWVHAEDRLWQMEGMRRLGAGRLAEILGARAVETDRRMRTLGLYRLAEAQYGALSDETRATFDAYATGVNAWMNQRRPLPPEFLLLGHAPEPWRPADSLVWGKLMALMLSSNHQEELARARLARRLTPRQLDELWMSAPAGPPSGGASNAWAVAGRHTASGKPVLAHDPHLPFSAPGPWYLTRIRTPSGEVAGAGAAGVPVVLLGHNGRAAWGFTTTGGDTEDLFIEEIDDVDGGRFRTPSGWRPLTTRLETIKVRDGDAVEMTVRETGHGPVVAELPAAETADTGSAGGRRQVLALAATYLDVRDVSPDAMLRLRLADDCPQLFAALADYRAPLQNVVCADVAGGIGIRTAGRVPVRGRGDGTKPAPGWTGTHDWIGEIPFTAMPGAVDPPSGVLVNANNRVVTDDYPWFITARWEPDWRAERIAEMLAAERPYSPDAAHALQADAVSPMARDLKPLMLAALPESHRLKPVVERLAAWSGVMARDRPEPLIFHAWLRHLYRALYADELGPEFARFGGHTPQFIAFVLAGGGDHWCDDVETPIVETCGERTAAALDAALAELGQRFGRDPPRWRWGDAHRARFRHRLLGELPVIGRWTDIEVATDGDAYTVNRGATDIGHPSEPDLHRHGSGYRAVYDLADLGRSRFIVVPGQSGHPLSRFYGNLVRPWRDGEALLLTGSAETLRGDAIGRLRLAP